MVTSCRSGKVREAWWSTVPSVRCFRRFGGTGMPSREAPPQTAEVTADLLFPWPDPISGALTQGLAVMIGRPPPPAAPNSGPPSNRPCHSKVAGQDTACKVVERVSQTLRRLKTQDKCQSPGTEGALVSSACAGGDAGPGARNAGRADIRRSAWLRVHSSVINVTREENADGRPCLCRAGEAEYQAAPQAGAG